MKQLAFLFMAAVCMPTTEAFGFDLDFKFGFEPELAVLEDMTLTERYPPGSITTRKMADRAISDVRREKERVSRLSQEWSDRCYDNFFVNRCLDKIRRARIRQERRMLHIEAEASRVVRLDDSRKEKERQAARDAKAAEGPSHPMEPSEGRATANPERAARTKEAFESRRRDVEERRLKHEDARRHEAENLAAHEERLSKRDREAAERDQKVMEREKKKAAKAGSPEK